MLAICWTWITLAASRTSTTPCPSASYGSAAAEVPAGYHTSVKDFQRQLIQRVLEQAGGNQSRAAQILGLQRTYLSRLIRNLGLR